MPNQFYSIFQFNLIQLFNLIQFNSIINSMDTRHGGTENNTYVITLFLFKMHMNTDFISRLAYCVIANIMMPILLSKMSNI